MRKTKVALTKKLLLSKMPVAGLNLEQQQHIIGGEVTRLTTCCVRSRENTCPLICL
ncbi:class I lanthipeptide [Chitinophaga sp.]|uniref:class I lanthipeptide n=1 Tax=Chitinophaga sp. TaxID=1869181 RepID=UPI0039C85473